MSRKAYIHALNGATYQSSGGDTAHCDTRMPQTQHVQRVKSQFDFRLPIDGRRSSVSSYRIPVPPPENVTFGTQISRRTSLNPSFL